MKEIKNDLGRKLKVLVVPSDRTGVGYFRSTKPHLALEKNYPDEFHVDIDYEPRINDKEWLSKYDIVHYHRNLGGFEVLLVLWISMIIGHLVVIIQRI